MLRDILTKMMLSSAQNLAERAGKNPQIWDDVKKFLGQAGATVQNIKEALIYVPEVLSNEIEFSKKSLVKNSKKGKPQCVVGHWVTIGGRKVFICEQ